jgi:hypothetical protein
MMEPFYIQPQCTNARLKRIEKEKRKVKRKGKVHNYETYRRWGNPQARV